MGPKTKVKICLQCRKKVYRREASICCTTCESWVHQRFRCSKKKSEYFKKVDPNKFSCFYCVNFPCGKCEKPVFRYQNSLLCESECQMWFHLKCTSISLAQYTEWSKNPCSDPWFCKSCYSPPFSQLKNIEIGKMGNGKDCFQLATEKETSKGTYKPICSVCQRKINKNKLTKALECKSCKSLVHINKKCSGIKQNDLNTLSPSNF